MIKYLQLSVAVILLLVFFLFYAGNSIPAKVKTAIEMAGNNKGELLEVIDHYKREGNGKKLKAAYFLITNMPYKYHYYGPGLDKSRRLFSIMDSLAKQGHKNIGHEWDSLELVYPKGKLGAIDSVRDISVIKASMLIRHIDAAFVAWDFPWARKLSFDDFCEYILPYKLYNEEPELWNASIQASYRWMLDSLLYLPDARSACLLMNKQLKRNFFIGSFSGLCDINYTDLSKLRVGTCYHATQFSTYNLRAMGVPVSLDFTPYWANKNGGHSWNVLLENNKPIPFIGTESDPGKTKVEFAFYRKRAKIFRNMFSIQEQSLAQLVTNESDIPEIFRNSCIADVTAQYEPVSDVTIHVNGKQPDAMFAYLCVYNNRDWRPVYWGKINEDNQVVFKNMGRNIAYMPMYYQNREFVPAGPPFILNGQGLVETLDPVAGKKIAATLYRKGLTAARITAGKEYELFYWKDTWTSLGKYCAVADSLVCNNVPANALLLVSDSNQIHQDRIFTYRKGKQVWW